MIRQAISCDVCGAEKQQTNHWFVAYTQGGELRVTGWKANGRMRAGSKHLCGQTCLNKLVDEFVAGTRAARSAAASESGGQAETNAGTDASLTSKAAYPSARASVPVADAAVRSLKVMPAAVVAIAPAHAAAPVREMNEVAAPMDDAPNYGSPRWRAEAWERERERCSAGPRRKGL
jgi:hypothetical protein